MKKKLCFLLLSTGLLNLGIAQAQWNLETCPTNSSLNAISFVSSNSGWIVGDKGTILYKSDGGWKEYQKPTFENLYSIFMLNEKDGWAVGANGTIIRFDGKTWNPIVSPTKKNLLSVCFKDSENGIAVGEFGTVVIYLNGIWNVVENEIRGDLYTAFFESDDAWIGGGLECVNVPITKMVYKGGMTLINNFDSFATINSICFLNSYNGWAVGSPSTILHFDGLRWEKPLINDRFPSLKSVFFSDENNGISVGYSGTILIFSGDKWIKENSCVTQNLRGAAVIGNTFYAVGDSGTIVMKDLSANNKAIATIPQEVPGKILLFPNPCDEVLNINLPGKNDYAIVMISITNTYGQVIMQKKLNIGDGNLIYPIVTSELKNGLYFLQAVIGSKTTTIKFIIRH